MVWCSHCVEDVQVVKVPDQDYISCSFCGKILVYPIHKSHRMIGNRMIGKPKNFQGLHGRAASYLGCLFDIDDLEVAQYLCNAKDKYLRKIMWEEMNKEYLEVQAAKNDAAAAAAKGVCQALLANDSEKLLSAQELVTLTTAALAKSKKEKKHKHSTDNRSSTYTKSHGRELKRKSFSTKINYEALKGLYKDNAKKQRTTSEIGECENFELKIIEESHKKSEESAVNNAKDLISVDDDNNEGDDYYENGADDNYENPDEEYD